MSYSYDPSKTSIVIPLKNSTEEEIIEIDYSELPEGEEVLQILKGEKAALHYWLDLALEYYKNGMVDDFVKILEQSGGEAGLDYRDYEKDQMRALDMLAAHYVLMGNKERNKEKRKEWFTRATLLYTTADKIIMYDQNHLLGRAYFCLLEGNKVEQADAQFNFVLNQSQQTHEITRMIPAIVGKACIAFNRKEFKNALLYYKRCLRLNPKCPADIRVGMGYCFARLGHMDKARLAFERAIQIEPTNVPSIIALAVLDLNSGTAEGIVNGIKALGVAYHQDPENPMVLNHLANHFFYKQDLKKTHQLASHAHQVSDNDAMKAESMYHLARYYHKEGDYHHAFQFYYQATTLTHPKFVLPYYGLGQIHIYREEYENAITVFEKVLKMVPNDFDTLAVLGSLYTNVQHKDPKVNAERREKAREYLKKVVEQDQHKPPVEAMIELAQLQEQQDPQASLALYLRVAQVLKEDIEVDVPAEILNNIGALYFMLNQLEESKRYFQEARECILSEGAENLNDEATALLITTSYNLGRINEQLCLYDEAERLYRSIIRQRPNYIDCILRLGCLVRNKGDLHNASLLFKESMSVNPNNPDPWTLIGNMHMAKDEWGPAQKKFEHILKLTNNTDVYSFIALGNIWLEMLFAAKTHEKDSLYRERAINYYAKALKFRPHNIWAANGIGCVLAHKGNFMDARDIFSQVREATADFPDVWINVAHIYMEQKQYVSALQMYKNCVSKFGRDNDIQLLGYIARAYWKSGKFAECRDCVERIMIEEPDRLIWRYNHAVVLQKMATNALKDEKSTLQTVTNAVEDLKISEKTFKYIASTSPDVVARAKYISRTVCSNEAQNCVDLLKQARMCLQRAQAKDEEERHQREQQEEQRRRILEEEAEKERERQQELMRKLEEKTKLRQFYVEQTKELLRLKELKEEKKVRVTGRKRKEGETEDFVNDDSSDLGEYENDEARKKAKGQGRPGGEFSASSDEGDQAGPSHERKRKKLKASERRARDRELDEQVPARMRSKIKSKAYLSSSSSSSPSPTRSPALQKSDEEEGHSDKQAGTDEEGAFEKTELKRKSRMVVDSDQEEEEKSGSEQQEEVEEQQANDSAHSSPASSPTQSPAAADDDEHNESEGEQHNVAGRGDGREQRSSGEEEGDGRQEMEQQSNGEENDSNEEANAEDEGGQQQPAAAAEEEESSSDDSDI